MKRLLILLLAIQLVIIIGSWFINVQLSDTASIFIAFGRLAGLIAVFVILLQFLFAGRTVFLEKTFGLDRLFRIHHLNGYASSIFLLSHPIFITLGYSIATKKNFINQFVEFITLYPDVLQAFVAVLLFMGIILFSIQTARKYLRYEAWYAIHLFTYLAILLAFGHQIENGSDFQQNTLFVYYWYALYALVFGNVFVFRFIWPLYLFYTHQFVVLKIEKETHDTVSIYISGKQLDTFQREPGQFMILRFLTKDFWWQAHPFSLSNVSSDIIRVTVKQVGDFTAEIGKIKPGAKVIIDGPYGIFTEKQSTKNKILLIAAGIGITPIRSLIEQMVKDKKDIVVLYGNKKQEDIVFKEELDALAKQYNFPVFYFLSQEKTKSPLLEGRITISRIQQLVQDVLDREIYICGPIEISKQLKSDFNKLGISSSLIHFEQFVL